MNTAAIILAAGASTRLGHPKQLVQQNGETLIDRAIRIACEAGLSPIIVVLGASADTIQQQAKLRNAHIAINPHWQSGMATSIRHGLSALPPGTEATILMNCDQPAVNTPHLQSLLAALEGATMAASTYAGRTGTPAAFLHQHFAELNLLRGDQGARSLLMQDGVALIPLPDGNFDIDTPEDLERLNKIS